MYIQQEETKWTFYFTEEEVARLNEEDKKILKPCDKTFNIAIYPLYKEKHYCMYKEINVTIKLPIKIKDESFTTDLYDFYHYK